MFCSTAVVLKRSDVKDIVTSGVEAADCSKQNIPHSAPPSKQKTMESTKKHDRPTLETVFGLSLLGCY